MIFRPVFSQQLTDRQADGRRINSSAKQMLPERDREGRERERDGKKDGWNYTNSLHCIID